MKCTQCYVLCSFLFLNFVFSVLSSLLLILSWYHSLGCKPLHRAWRVARSQEEEHREYCLANERKGHKILHIAWREVRSEEEENQEYCLTDERTWHKILHRSVDTNPQSTVCSKDCWRQQSMRKQCCKRTKCLKIHGIPSFWGIWKKNKMRRYINCKINHGKRYEPLIKIRKDEEHVEEVNVFFSH
jgi:hypothetical protein